MVTVFTPTYNRAYIIENLYNSLKRQTCMNFEWLVIDDGSSDNTCLLFDQWILEKDFPIRYLKIENGGKHRAINRGVMEARGDLFFIVDSDDYLADDAIEKIYKTFNDICDKIEYAGVCGVRCYSDGSKIGGECDFGVLDCNSMDFRFKFKIKGDMAEVIRTDVMREFPFPEFEGEKFCPEAVFFNRVAQKYILRYFYDKIYICDYLPDGLSAKITKLRMDSPLASMTCYSELAHSKIPFVQKIKATINYWRFSFCSHTRFLDRICNVDLYWLLLLPIGYAFHIIDAIKYKL